MTKEKLTAFEKIKFLLEMGVYKCVRVELMDWIRIDYYIEEELALHEVDDMAITSITPIPNPPKLLPVGTKVRVFEEYSDVLVDQEFIITQTNHMWYVATPMWVTIPARAVVPVWEE